jgi:hypothetical protein
MVHIFYPKLLCVLLSHCIAFDSGRPNLDIGLLDIP